MVPSHLPPSCFLRILFHFFLDVLGALRVYQTDTSAETGQSCIFYHKRLWVSPKQICSPCLRITKQSSQLWYTPCFLGINPSLMIVFYWRKLLSVILEGQDRTQSKKYLIVSLSCLYIQIHPELLSAPKQFEVALVRFPLLFYLLKLHNCVTKQETTTSTSYSNQWTMVQTL